MLKKKLEDLTPTLLFPIRLDLSIKLSVIQESLRQSQIYSNCVTT